jgi:hypothetical protein
MGHQDVRVERVLDEWEAGHYARLAAQQLFTSWDEFTSFFLTIFEDYSDQIGPDISTGQLRARYETEDAVQSLAYILHRVAEAKLLNISASHLAVFLHYFLDADPLLLQSADSTQVWKTYDRVSALDTDQLRAFDSYRITNADDRNHVYRCLISYKLPVDFVRVVSLGLSREVSPMNAASLRELHVAGVHGFYASRVATACAYLESLRYDHSRTAAPSTDISAETIGAPFARLSTELAEDIDLSAWFILALHAEGVPADYAYVCAGRTAADIIELYQAGVPGNYARSVGWGVATSVVIRAHADGIASEYLLEVTS